MSDSSSSNHRVLVYGGAGALGRAIVTTFVKAGSKVDSADFVVNHEASKNHTLEGAFEESLKTLVKTLKAEGGA
jgi:NAD(P)-dependent dehydrogenase (short-subunit alcohol dehydrogenase family)